MGTVTKADHEAANKLYKPLGNKMKLRYDNVAFEKTSGNSYRCVTLLDRLRLGFVREIEGEYFFNPMHEAVYLTARYHRDIASFLDQLNKKD